MMGESSTVINLHVPTIDISGYLEGDPAKTSEIVKQLTRACESPGFFQIVGHGIDKDIQTEILARLVDFFGSPPETKQAVHRLQSSIFRGYEAIGEQKLDPDFPDQKEGFTIGFESETTGFMRGANLWPPEADVPGFRAAFTRYFEVMVGLSKLVFRLMALSLNLDETYFDDFVTGQEAISRCRAHRYPPTTEFQAKNSRGIGAHTDFGAVTLLLQDQVGGLEVFDKPTETWHPVKPVENAFVVNMGDMMEIWTNNRYTSTMHRVISPVSGSYRYSIAFFNQGCKDVVIECIPSCLKKGEQPRYKAVTVEQHLKARLRQSY